MFARCRMDAAVGMGGALWLGFSAGEVSAAWTLSRVPRRDWTRVCDGVQLMGRIAAEHARQRERKAAEERK